MYEGPAITYAGACFDPCSCLTSEPSEGMDVLSSGMFRIGGTILVNVLTVKVTFSKEVIGWRIVLRSLKS